MTAADSGSTITPFGSSRSSATAPLACSNFANCDGSRPAMSVRRHSSSVRLGMGRRSYASRAVCLRFRSQSGSPRSSVRSRVSALKLISADRALHLELDEAVELHRVLERKLLGEGLDEAVDD